MTDDPKIAIAWTPAVRGSDTSLDAAAAKARGGGARRDRDRVLRMLAKRSATDEQIGAELELAGNTVRPRRGELVKNEWARDSGAREKTSSGRRATVWEVTASGRTALREIEANSCP